MNSQRWLKEIETRCEDFTHRNSTLTINSIEERDRLIRFAKRVIDEKDVCRASAMSLIDMADQKIFST